MLTLTNIFKSLNASLNARMTTPKKNVKYLKAGREQEQYNKYKHNWLLAEAGMFMVFWLIGLMKHVGGAYINLLLVLAVGTILYALPYSYRQFNLRHHI